jgi:hypothetical protein
VADAYVVRRRVDVGIGHNPADLPGKATQQPDSQAPGQ